jgi:RNA polymerase sigma factor (sigma-70 family)
MIVNNPWGTRLMAMAPFTDLLDYLRKVCGAEAARDLSDAELLERFRRQRDEAAFSVIVHRHGPMVLGVCRRVLGDSHDAEDAFQAAFLLLVRRAASIARAGSLPAWLHGVAQRVAIRVRTQRRIRRERERAVHPMPSIEPVDDVTWQELRGVLDQEFARLAKKHSAPLILCYLEGKNYDQAGRELGWSKSTVCRRLDEARELLRERLMRRGITLTAGALATVLCERLTGPAVGATLTINTIKAAASLAAGKAVAATYASAQVMALADGAMTGIAGVNAKVVFIAIAIGLGIGGVGVARYGGVVWNQEPVKAAETPQQPASEKKQTPPDNPKPAFPQAEQARVDFYGDPLPPGALFRLGSTRYRASGQLKWLGFLPKDNTLVTAGDSIQFWDITTGKVTRQIDLKKFVSRLGYAMSGDGKYFAVGGSLTPPQGINRPPAVVGIWDLRIGKEVRSVEAPDASVDYAAIALTPDGKSLISLSRMGLLLIQDAATGAEQRRHQFQRDNGGNLALSADGSIIAVGTGMNTRKVFTWKWQTPEEPRDLRAPAPNGHWLAFSPDGNLLAESGQSERIIRVWDVLTGDLRHKLTLPTDNEGHINVSLLFSSDGKTLLVATLNNRVGVGGRVDFWDTAKGEFLRSFDGSVAKLATSIDGRHLAGVSGGIVRVWNIESGELLGGADESHEYPVHQIVAAANTIVTASIDNTLRLWNAATGKQILKLAQPDLVWSAVSISPDGTELVSGHYDSMMLWDTATGRPIYKLPGHGPRMGCENVLITSDEKSFLSVGFDLRVRKVSITTGKALLETDLNPRDVPVFRDNEDPFEQRFAMEKRLIDGVGKGVFSADGSVFVLDTRKEFHVLDVATGKDMFQLPNVPDGRGGGTALAMSHDGRMLLTNSPSMDRKTHVVTLWELATRQARKTVVFPAAGTACAAFSTDGKLFAASAGAPDCQVRVWEAKGGTEVLNLKGFDGTIRSLAFAAGSNLLVTGMSDSTVLIWDLKALVRK